MLILLLLTLIGIAVTNTSTIEIQISGNDRVQKQAFYNAEAAYTAVRPLLDDIRLGVDPTTFAATYSPDLAFVGTGGGLDFWDEQLDDGDDVTDLPPLDPGPETGGKNPAGD